MKKVINLINIEIIRIFKSKVYWLFVTAFILFSLSQIGIIFTIDENIISYPKKEDYKDYNFEKIKLEIMSDKIGSLGYEYTQGSYKAAPFGINKQVRIDNDDTKKIEQILEMLIGQKKQVFVEWFKDYNKCRQVVTKVEGNYSIDIMKNIPPSINQSLSWEQFLMAMDEVSVIIGKGSYYNRSLIEEELLSEKSYDDALTEYNDLLHKDKILGAVSRILSDYLGIILAFLPVIIGVLMVHEDKKYNICDIIYSKKISSFKIISSRYFAALITIMIVVIIAMFLPSTFIGIKFILNGYEVDFLAFAKYSFGWLMPTVMMSLAMGFFISELLNGIIAIFTQFIWFYTSIFLHIGSIIGYVGTQIVPRFNSFGEYHRFELFFNELLVNRIIYFIASIGVILITAILHTYKRKGKLSVKNIFYYNKE